MTRILLLSACLIAATTGQALAYSNVSPIPSPNVKVVDRGEWGSFDASGYVFTPDGYRYHGGPKAND